MAKIIIAPDSFKHSLDSVSVARAIAQGVRSVLGDADVIELPIADGGEGTVTAMLRAVGGERRRVVVEDPLGRPIDSVWGLLSDGTTAVVELAACSGLQLIAPAERNPLVTSTYGLGQLIAAVLDAGPRRIILGIGGSATVDGGVGMLTALGVGMLDAEGNSVPRGGAGLCQLAAIDLANLDPQIEACDIRVACDVENPLVGACGAARVFGPQKGANPADVEILEAGLLRLGECIEAATGVSVLHAACCGAAGGVSAACRGLLGADLERGSELVLDACGFDDLLAETALVVTGEGKLDSQSLGGKAPCAVAARAREKGVPVIAVAGCLESSPELEACFDRIISLTGDSVSQEEGMQRAHELLHLSGVAAGAWLAARDPGDVA